jgi:hypothetical protein
MGVEKSGQVYSFVNQGVHFVDAGCIVFNDISLLRLSLGTVTPADPLCAVERGRIWGFTPHTTNALWTLSWHCLLAAGCLLRSIKRTVLCMSVSATRNQRFILRIVDLQSTPSHRENKGVCTKNVCSVVSQYVHVKDIKSPSAV